MSTDKSKDSTSDTPGRPWPDPWPHPWPGSRPAIVQIAVDWDACAEDERLPSVIATLRERHREDSEPTGKCVYVYRACGSCPNDEALVEAYCGAGGPEADFSWCEPC